jgi:hypothetical protein
MVRPPATEVLVPFDRALSGRESAARARMTEMLAERSRRGEDRQALLRGHRLRADAGGVPR